MGELGMKHYYVITSIHGKSRKKSSPFKTRKAAERWARICKAGAPMSVTYEIVSEEA